MLRIDWRGLTITVVLLAGSSEVLAQQPFREWMKNLGFRARMNPSSRHHVGDIYAHRDMRGTPLGKLQNCFDEKLVKTVEMTCSPEIRPA